MGILTTYMLLVYEHKHTHYEYVCTDTPFLPFKYVKIIQSSVSVRTDIPFCLCMYVIIRTLFLNRDKSQSCTYNFETS